MINMRKNNIKNISQYEEEVRILSFCIKAIRILNFKN